MLDMFGLRLLTFMAVALMGSAAWAKGDVAGHYYLQGVRETGSELLLRPDGRFEWYITYGAVDQTARGTWTRTGDTIELHAEGPDRSAPLLRLDERGEWDASTEQALLDLAHEQALADVEKACPLQQIAEATTPPSIAFGTPDLPALKAEAEASLAKAKAAREAAERTVPLAIRDLGAPDAEARLQVARDAMTDWQIARAHAEAAYRNANLPPPDLGEPQLPEACTPPPESRVDTDHPERWKGGIVISIADPEMGMAPKGINVTLTYADGMTATAKTAHRGWAIFPRRPGITAGHVLIDSDVYQLGKVAFDFPPLEKGLQAFAIDVRQLIGAPFVETMALRVEGDDLIPTGLGRGRYVREGR